MPGEDLRLFLVHWHAREAEEMASQLRQPVLRADKFEMRELKAALPCLLLISLRRLPSHGREVADAVRATKWGRSVPIVFIDGPADKVAALRLRFPTASFTTWEELPALLELPLFT